MHTWRAELSVPGLTGLIIAGHTLRAVFDGNKSIDVQPGGPPAPAVGDISVFENKQLIRKWTVPITFEDFAR